MADELLQSLGKQQRELDESDPPLADAVAGDEGEALLDGLFEELDAKPATEGSAPEAEPAEVVELPRKRSAMWATAGVVFAAAAALVLWFATRTAAPPELPQYTAVTITGGPAAVRGDHDAVQDVVKLRNPSDTIDWRVAAESPVEQEIAVSLLASQNGGKTVFAAVADAKISGSGSVRLRGPLDRFIELTPGSWSVDIVISPASYAPTESTGAASDKWQRVSIEVIIASP